MMKLRNESPPSAASSTRLNRAALADHDKKPALLAQRMNPAELREPAFWPPVVSRMRKQILRVLADERAGISAHVFHAALAKPALHFGDGVPVFFGMLI